MLDSSDRLQMVEGLPQKFSRATTYSVIDRCSRDRRREMANVLFVPYRKANGAFSPQPRSIFLPPEVDLSTSKPSKTESVLKACDDVPMQRLSVVDIWQNDKRYEAENPPVPSLSSFRQ